jgi:hypothetical protein
MRRSAPPYACALVAPPTAPPPPPLAPPKGGAPGPRETILLVGYYGGRTFFSYLLSLLSFRMISDTRIECRNANSQGETVGLGPTV